MILAKYECGYMNDIFLVYRAPVHADATKLHSRRLLAEK